MAAACGSSWTRHQTLTKAATTQDLHELLLNASAVDIWPLSGFIQLFGSLNNKIIKLPAIHAHIICQLYERKLTTQLKRSLISLQKSPVGILGSRTSCLMPQGGRGSRKERALLLETLLRGWWPVKLSLFIYYFLGLHPRHMEFIRLGSNQRRSCRLTPKPKQCRIQATSMTYTTGIEAASSRILVGFVSCLQGLCSQVSLQMGSMRRSCCGSVG